MTVVVSPNGRIARPIRGLQLLESLCIRLRSGKPAAVAVMMGSVAATAGAKSVGMEEPAVTMLPDFGSKVNIRSNFSTHGVWYS